MPDELNVALENEEKSKEPIPHGSGQVGASLVGPIGIVLITIYLILFSIFLLYSLVQLWPSPNCSTVTFLIWTNPVSDEVRLLLIVALAGALGGLVHALRSLYWYVGHRALKRSWTVKYILLPFVGSSLGLVFYFVIRGGFFSWSANAQQTNLYGFVALAGLVGLFSEQAVLKLKEVAETLLAKPEKGADAEPQEKADAEYKDKV